MITCAHDHGFDLDSDNDDQVILSLKIYRFRLKAYKNTENVPV